MGVEVEKIIYRSDREAIDHMRSLSILLARFDELGVSEDIREMWKRQFGEAMEQLRPMKMGWRG